MSFFLKKLKIQTFKLIGNLDYEHRNPNILKTTPDDTIMRKDPDKITIQYNKSVTFSFGNISIYQIIDDDVNYLLRQTYPGRSRHTSIINDTTVNIKILSSTFNNPRASYFVTIDDGFISSKQYNEAIMGISKRVWFLNTCKFILVIKRIFSLFL